MFYFVFNEEFLIVVPRSLYILLVTGKPEVFTVTKMGFSLDPRFLALKMYYRLRMYVPVKKKTWRHTNTKVYIHIHTQFHVHLQSIVFKRSPRHIFLPLQCTLQNKFMA